MEARKIERPSDDWESYRALVEDPEALMASLRVLLVEMAFSGGSSARIRAVEALLGMSFAVPESSYGDEDYGFLERSASAFLEARGFVVARASVNGADRSSVVRPVHDAGIPDDEASSADDVGDSR